MLLNMRCSFISIFIIYSGADKSEELKNFLKSKLKMIARKPEVVNLTV